LVPLAVKTLLGHTYPSAMTIEIKGNTIALQRPYFALSPTRRWEGAGFELSSPPDVELGSPPHAGR
jgi:hypothetical protein